MDPTFIQARFNLANLHNKLGENSSALKVLRDGIQIAPKQGELYYSLGLLLAEDQQLEASAKELKQAVALLTDRPRVFYNYGLILQNLNRRKEAASTLRQAYVLDSKNPDIVYALVIFYAQQKEWRQALPYAQELVSLLPSRPEPKKLLSDIQAMGNK